MLAAVQKELACLQTESRGEGKVLINYSRGSRHVNIPSSYIRLIGFKAF